MMGALIGACRGGILAAWIAGQSPRRTLDFLAPALLLFVACERLAAVKGVHQTADPVKHTTPARGILEAEARFACRVIYNENEEQEDIQ